MPISIVSPTLFNAQALPADPDDTHLQPGIHLRVSSHPLLGLPVAPFVVWRALAKGPDRTKPRSDAVFVDSRGALLEAPFNLAPDNPVTAYLALKPGETCIWASVRADPGTGGDGRPPPGSVFPPGRPPLPGTVLPPDAVRPPPGTIPPLPGSTRPPPGSIADRIRDTIASGGLDPGRRVGDLVGRPAAGSGIVATAFVGTARGPAPLASRSAPPFAFAGPGIVQIRLEGRGAVAGVLWVEQSAQQQFDWQPWTILNLPHKGGPRYLAIDGALALATARLLAQAPKRRPLQETLGATPPSAAPLEGPAYEAMRVASLTGPIGPDLDRLVTDLSAPPLELVAGDPIFDERGREIGAIEQRCIDRVFQSRLDPGTAALLGYKGLDREYAEPESLMVFYWVAGFFRRFPAPRTVPPGDPAIEQQLAALSGDNRIGGRDALVRAFRKALNGLDVPIDDSVRLEDHEDYIGLGALAVADRGAAPDPMQPPAIDGSLHVGWMPETPPRARREVQVFVTGVAVGGLLAAEKQTPSNGTLREPMNKANEEGFHLPLVLGRNADDETQEPGDAPGSGFIPDRQAADTPVRYYLAQQDAFGRWSGWASTVNPPGARPAPPPPVIRAVYTQPADPAAGGGTVRVMVDVPPLESLAPGAFPIERLELTASNADGSGPVLHAHPVGDPLAPAERLDFSFAGPLLAPTEVRKLRLVAIWRDTAGTPSAQSEPQLLTMHDPRPPAQLPVPDVLQYAGRPDVTGLSTVEHSWSAAPGQARFAVHYTDENRLIAHLRGQPDGSAGATLAESLEAAAGDPAARATLLRANTGLFPAHLFERLDGVVQDLGGGRFSFRHPVSGSLRVLSLYRISAESASSARVDLATLPLLVFAVPNADPPARPVLEVLPADLADNTGAYAAILRITLTAGVTQAATWRLRRSSLGATDSLRMPVVGTGPMGPVEADGRQRAEVPDAGPVQISATARLQPWVRYHWVAEAQGDFAPGSVAAGRPVPGAWSAPSEPVSLMLVPPAPPGPPLAPAASGAAAGAGSYGDVEIAFDHAERLAGGAMGAYRVRVERRAPGGAMESVGTVDVGPAPYRVSGMRADDPADLVAAGTVYRLSIVDPLGREGPAAETTLE